MHITDAESQVMEPLWESHPLSSEALIGAVRARRAAASSDWGEATVKTLINRLLKKKAIASEKFDGRHGYRPLVSRAEYLQAESQDLLDRLFDGQLAPMITHFAEHRKLKPDEVSRLKRLIAELDDEP